MAFRCNPLFFMSSTKSFLVTAQALPSFSLRSESELSRSSLLVYVKGAHSGALFWFEPLRGLDPAALGLSLIDFGLLEYRVFIAKDNDRLFPHLTYTESVENWSNL